MKKVLIIEDDPLVQTTYRDELTQEGFDVIAAGTGQEGIQLAKTNQPNIILLDIMLPQGMNGFDVLRQLKLDTATQKIPVIVLTNLDSEEAVARDMGAVDYLVKANMSIDDVVTKIKKYIQ